MLFSSELVDTLVDKGRSDPLSLVNSLEGGVLFKLYPSLNMLLFSGMNLFWPPIEADFLEPNDLEEMGP